jgi:hypothetical protein
MFVSHLRAQAADIPPPDTRIAFVKKVSDVIQIRGKVVTISDDYVNPFQGKVVLETIAEHKNIVVPVGLSGPELLSKLANEIPSTGTLQFGGSAMLLMGSKRAKIGETISVHYDNKDYQLVLTAITPTTFTVMLGDQASTRPVRKR